MQNSCYSSSKVEKQTPFPFACTFPFSLKTLFRPHVIKQISVNAYCWQILKARWQSIEFSFIELPSQKFTGGRQVTSKKSWAGNFYIFMYNATLCEWRKSSPKKNHSFWMKPMHFHVQCNLVLNSRGEKMTRGWNNKEIGVSLLRFLKWSWNTGRYLETFFTLWRMMPEGIIFGSFSSFSHSLPSLAFLEFPGL